MSDSIITLSMTFDEVCQQHAISAETLRHLIDYGLFSSDLDPIESVLFDPIMIQRLLRAYRLQADLELNVQGVVLVLELLDELEQLRDELNVLNRHRNA